MFQQNQSVKTEPRFSSLFIFKGISSFTHPRVVLNLWDFLSSVENKGYFEKCFNCFSHTMCQFGPMLYWTHLTFSEWATKISLNNVPCMYYSLHYYITFTYMLHGHTRDWNPRICVVYGFIGRNLQWYHFLGQRSDPVPFWDPAPPGMWVWLITLKDLSWWTPLKT